MKYAFLLLCKQSQNIMIILLSAHEGLNVCMRHLTLCKACKFRQWSQLMEQALYASEGKFICRGAVQNLTAMPLQLTVSTLHEQFFSKNTYDDNTTAAGSAMRYMAHAKQQFASLHSCVLHDWAHVTISHLP